MLVSVWITVRLLSELMIGIQSHKGVVSSKQRRTNGIQTLRGIVLIGKRDFVVESVRFTITYENSVAMEKHSWRH